MEHRPIEDWKKNWSWIEAEGEPVYFSNIGLFVLGPNGEPVLISRRLVIGSIMERTDA